MKLGDFCRLSPDRRRHFVLTPNNVNAHAALTRSRVEAAFAELGPEQFGRRAQGVELQHVGVTEHVRQLLTTVATRIVRAPARKGEPFVLASVEDSLYAGKPLSVFDSSTAGKSWLVTLRDALPVKALAEAAKRAAAPDLDAFLASRADLAATVARADDPRESEDSAVARVRLRRAIAEDLAEAGGLGWILHGTELPTALAARSPEKRTRARVAQAEAHRAETGDALALWQTDPSTLERPIAPPPLAPPTPDEVEQLRAAEAKAAHEKFVASAKRRLDLMGRVLTAKESGKSDPEALAELEALGDEEVTP